MISYIYFEVVDTSHVHPFKTKAVPSSAASDANGQHYNLCHEAHSLRPDGENTLCSTSKYDNTIMSSAPIMRFKMHGTPRTHW